MKKLLIGIMLVAMAGCASQSVKPLTTVCEKEYVSVLDVPAPPVLVRPDFPLDTITAEQLASDGELAKYMTASVVTLEDYTIILEKVIADYQKKHDEAEAMRKEIIAAGDKISALSTPGTTVPATPSK